MNAKTNLLQALINIDSVRDNSVSEMYTEENRINNVGVALEYYVKDMFCNAFELKDISEKDMKHSHYISYLGNQNNPPDFIIEYGDAVEVKKIGSQGSRIALNSSYPKNKLYKDDPRITNECRNCEPDWEEKDIIYSIGVVKKGELRLLWFVYGDCYSAARETYKKISDSITDGIYTRGYEFHETNELGKIKRADPLGITSLRIRGMWHIDNPLKVFSYIDGIEYEKDKDLTIYALMKEEKYNSFSSEDKEALKKSSLKVNDIELKCPDNPARFLQAKLIKGSYKDL